MKVARERCGELDSRHSGRSDGPQETTKRSGSGESLQPNTTFRTITVYILSDQMNLFVAQRLETYDFRDDFTCGTASFPSPRVRNNAERTELVAAFDNRNESDVR